MLKLLLCTAILSPCIVMQFVSAIKTEAVEYNTTSFEAYYIEPEFERLEACNTAELDVFFHDQYVTMHSAEYIAEAVEFSEKCDEVEYVIQPIQPIYSSDESMGIEEVTVMQARELFLILKAHGVEAKIAETQIQTKFDSLSENGRTAILRIDIKNTNNGKAA